jgi:hypothetical protein
VILQRWKWRVLKISKRGLDRISCYVSVTIKTHSRFMKFSCLQFDAGGRVQQQLKYQKQIKTK